MSEGRILLSHPHAAAVANDAARALERHGMLASYVTGVAAAEDTKGAGLMRLGARVSRVLLNRVVPGIHPDHLRSLALTELAARAMARVAPRSWLGERRGYDVIFGMHDAAVARMTWRDPPTAVYAYEDAALRTFERAAREGAARVWDLPTPHWRVVEKIWIEEAGRWPGAMGPTPALEPDWKKARKDRELELADVVSVASRFTWESVERLGGDKPVFEVPYAFPIDRFTPKRTLPTGPFTVLAAGNQDLRKGTPYLLEAWRNAGLPDARLRIIGRMALQPAFLARYAGLYEHVPHLPRADLEREYQAADLLAFPTLGDGFGLVVQEAMCCATPVLTTPCGGGPECIDDGVEGWIVPPRDVDALVDRLRFAADHRARVGEMGRAARLRAERYGAAEAGERFVRELERALR